MKSKYKVSFEEILAFVLISFQVALYIFMWLRLLGDPSLKTMDFISLYSAGRLIRTVEYSQIYNADAEIIVQREVAGPEYEQPLIFNHPPYITLILWLIADDNYVQAYIYWTVAGFLVTLGCAVLIFRYLIYSGWEPRSALLAALGSATFFPIFISLLGGQDTVYSLFGLLIFAFALIRGNEIASGLGLAFATLTPTIAGALALPLFASRHRAGLWFIVGMIGLAIYSLLLVGYQGILDFLYLLKISSQGSHYGINWSAMYNLLGLLVRAFPNWSIDMIRSITWGMTGLSMLMMCIFWWNKRDQLNIQHIGIAVVLSVLTAPHLHLHGLSYLLLPLLATVVLLYESGKKTFAVLLVPVVSTLLIIILLLIPDWNFNIYYLLMLALFVGLMLLRNKTTNSIEDNKS